jgi:catechol 2,3-dioxygenase-like lactoylglutathione lyase family enzyme
LVVWFAARAHQNTILSIEPDNTPGNIMTVKRMDNVSIVVEDIDAAIEFFTELGLALEGRMPIGGEWAGCVTGVRGQRVEIAMMRTPDGHGRLELSRFDTPPSRPITAQPP